MRVISYWRNHDSDQVPTFDASANEWLVLESLLEVQSQDPYWAKAIVNL